jgi:hypothetical protein
MDERGVIVNYDTGEIMGELREGDRIVRKETSDFLDKSEVWNIERFFKGSVGELKKMNKDLNIYEKAFLFSISPFIGYYDCCLQHDNGRCMDIDAMVIVSGMSRSMVYDVIKSLGKKDILYKGKNSREVQFFINPWLFCKGNRINSVLKTMFKNYKVKVTNKRWGDI